MCGRFTLATPAEALVELLGLAAAPAVPPRYNIAPGQPVAAAGRRGPGQPTRLSLLHWGFEREGKGLLINARLETAHRLPAFREAFRSRRCLVPADGFYEWQRLAGHKQAFHIRRADGRPFAFAGLWQPRLGRDPAAVCVLLTTTPNELMAPIHESCLDQWCDTSGIGEATARLFAQEGAWVALVGRRKQLCQAIAEEIRAAGGRALALACDVSREDEIRASIEQTVEAFGGLHIVVNNAGMVQVKMLHECTVEDWDLVMGVNVRSMFLATRLAAPELAKRKGSVVNLSSVAGLRPYPGLIAYCVSKAAVDMLTRCAALDLAPQGVRVNAVNPGVVVTELHTIANAVPDYPAFLERAKAVCGNAASH